MRGGDRSYPGVQLPVWNVTKGKLHQSYLLSTYLKLLSASILTVRQLRSATC